MYETMGRYEIDYEPHFKGNVVMLQSDEDLEYGDIVYLNHHGKVQKAKGENEMSIRIKADRVKMYKVTEIKALRWKDLPKEYLQGFPCMYLNEYGNLIVQNTNKEGQDWFFFHVGDELTEKEFERLDEIVTAAGDRLHKINHKHHIAEKKKKTS